MDLEHLREHRNNIQNLLDLKMFQRDREGRKDLDHQIQALLDRVYELDMMLQ